jgi:drug/metabolite transporter (DMT)-like permease
MAYGVPTLLVSLAMVVAQIGYGGYGPIVKKFAPGQANPLVFCLIRDSVSFPILLLCSVVAERRFNRPHLKELPLFFFLGLFGESPRVAFLSENLHVCGCYFV